MPALGDADFLEGFWYIKVEGTVTRCTLSKDIAAVLKWVHVEKLVEELLVADEVPGCRDILHSLSCLRGNYICNLDILFRPFLSLHDSLATFQRIVWLSLFRAITLLQYCWPINAVT